MPRRRTEPPVIPTTSLVASSAHYSGGKVPRIYIQRQDWQRECYRHYSICGEARFAARFFGHAVSRAVLSASVIGPDGKPAPAPEQVKSILDSLFNGKDGQTEMLESFGTHLAVAGECYLVGREVDQGPGTDPVDVWEIVSVMEMQVTGTNWQINYGDGSTPIDLDEEDVIIRVWLPMPGRKIEADSPFRSLLPILGEIEYLTRHVFAQITSRLAGAGILFLSQNVTFPPAPDQDGAAGESANDAEAFMRTLADAMLKPIQDPSSPAAMVPIVAMVPDEVVDKAHLLTFWTDLDANSKELRNEALRRFALGMDLPPEQILGISSRSGSGGGQGSSVSHWGAWQIEEATIKLHIEPMLDVIVNALTMGFLRPQITTTDSGIYIVSYNTAALRLRPDRSKEAFELFDRGQLSPDALLRETGFDLSDKPDDSQFKRWLLVKIASGSATPEQVAAAVAALGVILPMAPPVAIESGDTREARPAPSLMEHPVRPRTPDAAALLAGSDALVYRALERAGNRLRQGGQRPPNVPAFETHCHVKANGSVDKVLEDAWSCAEQVLGDVADVDAVVPVLNSYCENLIREQTEHSKARLAEWLSLAGVL